MDNSLGIRREPASGRLLLVLGVLREPAPGRHLLALLVMAPPGPDVLAAAYRLKRGRVPQRLSAKRVPAGGGLRVRLHRQGPGVFVLGRGEVVDVVRELAWPGEPGKRLRPYL